MSEIKKAAEQAAADAPELSDEQRERLRVLLNPEAKEQVA